MSAFKQLFSALPLLSLAYFAQQARAQIPAPNNTPPGGSICSTKTFLLETVLPAGLNAHGGVALGPPVVTLPTYTGLSVGMENYTCAANGTWVLLGATSYLYDISCLPLVTHRTFTSFIAGLWDAAPPPTSAADLVAVTEKLSPGFGLGIHFSIPDPRSSPKSGKILPKWDFSQSERFANVTNKENAFLVATIDGNVPDPFTPTLNPNWQTLPVLELNGKKQGQLADQVIRINTNGGQAPNSTCTPGVDTLLVKSTQDFLFYGGAWADTIF